MSPSTSDPCKLFRFGVDSQAWQSALRPKVCRLALHDKLRTLVASKLMQDWSPEQSSGWLKQFYPDDESKRVSHETIYRTLFLQARGALKQGLARHLRSRRRIRRSRHARKSGHRMDQIADAISIREHLRKSKIAPSPVTGKAICCAGPATATLSRWWSVVRASACW